MCYYTTGSSVSRITSDLLQFHISSCFQIGSACSFLFVLVVSVLQAKLNPMWYIAEVNIYIAASCLTFLGLGLGFALSAACRQPWTVCRTVAIETGCQESGLCMSIIATSFPATIAKEMLTFPLLFAILSLIDMLLCIAVFKVCKLVANPHQKESEEAGGSVGGGIEEIDIENEACLRRKEITTEEFVDL